MSSDFKVNNEELYEELCKYIDAIKINPDAQMSNKLGRMIQRIVTGFASRSNFTNYEYKDEMISLAIYYTCKYIKNFDLAKKNVHAWISKVSENSFKSVINSEKQKLYVKYKIQLSSDNILNFVDSTNSQILKGNAGDFQKMESFVEEYEESQIRKLAKKRLKVKKS